MGLTPLASGLSAMQLVEIIPLSDELVIETELEVQDIISISLGQNASEFSAYDPGIYGYLNASVEKIGIDTQQREDGSCIIVRVKTKVENLIGRSGAEFVPGMMASVEIIEKQERRSIYAVQIVPVDPFTEVSYSKKQ